MELCWVRRSFCKSHPGEFSPYYQTGEVDRQGSGTKQSGQVMDGLHPVYRSARRKPCVTHTPHPSVAQANGRATCKAPLPDYHQPHPFANDGNFQNMAMPARPRINLQASAQYTHCFGTTKGQQEIVRVLLFLLKSQLRHHLQEAFLGTSAHLEWMRHLWLPHVRALTLLQSPNWLPSRAGTTSSARLPLLSLNQFKNKQMGKAVHLCQVLSHLWIVQTE